jgi:hypothetical protein
MAKHTAGSYHRTTIDLTDEQWRWLSRLAAQARLDDLPAVLAGRATHVPQAAVTSGMQRKHGHSEEAVGLDARP